MRIPGISREDTIWDRLDWTEATGAHSRRGVPMHAPAGPAFPCPGSRLDHAHAQVITVHDPACMPSSPQGLGYAVTQCFPVDPMGRGDSPQVIADSDLCLVAQVAIGLPTSHSSMGRGLAGSSKGLGRSRFSSPSTRITESRHSAKVAADIVGGNVRQPLLRAGADTWPMPCDSRS